MLALAFVNIGWVGSAPMTGQTEVTAAQIARLAGVGRAAVSNWRRRHPGFPSPVGGSDTSPQRAGRAARSVGKRWAAAAHGRYASAPPPSRAHPRPKPGSAPSPWRQPSAPPSNTTAAHKTPNAAPQARPGPRQDAYSPHPPAPHSSPPTPPTLRTPRPPGRAATDPTARPTPRHSRPRLERRASPPRSSPTCPATPAQPSPSTSTPPSPTPPAQKPHAPSHVDSHGRRQNIEPGSQLDSYFEPHRTLLPVVMCYAASPSSRRA